MINPKWQLLYGVNVLSFKIVKGVVWTKFDEDKGPTPVAWVPETLSDEILFSVSLRGMSVFSNRPSNISYAKMIATLPFPEYESFSVSTVLYEAAETRRGGFDINLVTVLIPQLIMENSWLDIRQIQGIFSKYFAPWDGRPVNDREKIITGVALAIDDILGRKFEMIEEGEKARDQLNNYLDSYLVTSRSQSEQQLIRTRVKTLIQSLDRVLEAGDHERIQEALNQLSFILNQGFEDELILAYQGAFSHFLQI
jgi:ribosomal protein S20